LLIISILMPLPTPRLILASASPRRVELLREAGYQFEVRIPEVEESHDPQLTCQELTLENARLKARAITQQEPGALVIAADTLVYLDNVPFGKPDNLAHAAEMLRQLSNRTHTVCTGVAVASSDGFEKTFAVLSEVAFKALDDATIADYHSRIQPLDKAGAYAVQDESAMIIQSVAGSWSNVKGLPMERLTEELDALHIPKILVS
jgi:septum formation protein